MTAIQIIRNCIIFFSLVFLSILFLKEKQNEKLNWSLFFSCLWISISLAVINFICVRYNFWYFNDNSIIKIPFDLYFLWIIFWGVIPFYIFKGKYIFRITLLIIIIDLIYMPLLQHFDILKLNKNWLIGELLLILFVFIPSYYWAKIFYKKKTKSIRALFQVIIMFLLFFIILPFILKSYNIIKLNISSYYLYYIQIGFIIAIPSLTAVIDFVNIGKGTPFPYDKTQKLVRTGVYAYCRNPIQWSFLFIFIPLSLVYQSYIILLGSIISLLYTIGVSNPQEYSDMKKRYGKAWTTYKNNVPNWWFLFRPTQIPNGTIYFKKDCNQCEQIRNWFSKLNTINLNIDYSYKIKTKELLQVTYIDHYGNEYKSVNAISYALGHVNLIYASFGWFMRLPLINYLLQSIVNSIELNKNETKCKIK